jgi:hypothetical protein
MVILNECRIHLDGAGAAGVIEFRLLSCWAQRSIQSGPVGGFASVSLDPSLCSG